MSATLPMALAATAIDLDTPRRAQEGLLDQLARDRAALAIAVAPSGALSVHGGGRVIAPLAGRRPLAYLGRVENRPLVLVDGPEAARQAPSATLADPYAAGSTGEERSGIEVVGLRECGLRLTPVDATFAAVAVALRQWHEETRCVRCAASQDLREAGWVYRCPHCGAERYPRTDPCIIVAVTDEVDRLLLARAAHFPAGRFSVLAGYVEPGESLEAAVRREVWEEAGVRVHSVRYRGSQPWPFPRSLMCAFTARVHGTPTPRVDGVEIAEAAFYSRTEVTDLIERGQMRLPSGISVARSLVADWQNG
ncbi:MAG: NAD(+) diphosphatase [Bowdeniella nasicola]|nr:NAD(+) diphosphatase [Bowdeniella nasicola]